MSFLLDTAALSEFISPMPNRGFLKWMEANANKNMFTSTLSIAEVTYGIELLAESVKRRKLETWRNKLIDDFRDRIIPFDLDSAQIWGKLNAEARRAKQVLPGIDGQIAAIAVAHGLIIITRNERHFRIHGSDTVQTLNPWC